MIIGLSSAILLRGKRGLCRIEEEDRVVRSSCRDRCTLVYALLCASYLCEKDIIILYNVHSNRG